MKLRPGHTLEEPKDRFFGQTDSWKVIRYLNQKNVPYNKRGYEIKNSTMEFNVERHEKAETVTFITTETTESHKGHIRTITHHICMEREAAERFARFILEGK